MGSASELEYHILLARDLGYLSGNAHQVLNQRVLEVKRMLSALVSKVSAERAEAKAVGI